MNDMNEHAVFLSGDNFFDTPNYHISSVYGDYLRRPSKYMLDYTFLEHYHNFSEMVFITEGNTIQTINGIDYPVQSGDLFLIEGNTTHCFHPGTKFCLFNLLFDKMTLPLPWQELQYLPGYTMFFETEPRVRKPDTFRNHLRLNEYDSVQLAEKLVQLANFIRFKGNPYSRIEGLQLLLEIITDISKRYERHFENTDSPFPKINNAIVLMKKKFHRVITLEELASVAGLSERSFTRQFKIITQDTPIGYLMKIRLEHAKDYLENTSLSISEIAFKCGFTDSNYFTKFFKTQCHISPRQWRKNSRG